MSDKWFWIMTLGGATTILSLLIICTTIYNVSALPAKPWACYRNVYSMILWNSDEIIRPTTAVCILPK